MRGSGGKGLPTDPPSTSPPPWRGWRWLSAQGARLVKPQPWGREGGAIAPPPPGQAAGLARERVAWWSLHWNGRGVTWYPGALHGVVSWSWILVPQGGNPRRTPWRGLPGSRRRDSTPHPGVPPERNLNWRYLRRGQHQNGRLARLLEGGRDRGLGLRLAQPDTGRGASLREPPLPCDDPGGFRYVSGGSASAARISQCKKEAGVRPPWRFPDSPSTGGASWKNREPWGARLRVDLALRWGAPAPAHPFHRPRSPSREVATASSRSSLATSSSPGRRRHRLNPFRVRRPRGFRERGVVGIGRHQRPAEFVLDPQQNGRFPVVVAPAAAARLAHRDDGRRLGRPATPRRTRRRRDTIRTYDVVVRVIP